MFSNEFWNNTYNYGEHASGDHVAADGESDVVYGCGVEFECGGYGHGVDVSMEEEWSRHRRGDREHV